MPKSFSVSNLRPLLPSDVVLDRCADCHSAVQLKLPLSGCPPGALRPGLFSEFGVCLKASLDADAGARHRDDSELRCSEEDDSEEDAEDADDAAWRNMRGL